MHRNILLGQVQSGRAESVDQNTIFSPLLLSVVEIKKNEANEPNDLVRVRVHRFGLDVMSSTGGLTAIMCCID